MGEWVNVTQKLFRKILGIFTHIPANSEISRHNQTYSGIFRNYSGIFWTLWNPGIFRTLVYSESWHIQNQRHIQNPGIFRIGGILRTLSNIYKGALSETANGYNFCNISFSCLLVLEISMIFLMEVQFSLKKFLFNVKKYGGPFDGRGPWILT